MMALFPLTTNDVSICADLTNNKTNDITKLSHHEIFFFIKHPFVSFDGYHLARIIHATTNTLIFLLYYSSRNFDCGSIISSLCTRICLMKDSIFGLINMSRSAPISHFQFDFGALPGMVEAVSTFPVVEITKLLLVLSDSFRSVKAICSCLIFQKLIKN